MSAIAKYQTRKNTKSLQQHYGVANVRYSQTLRGAVSGKIVVTLFNYSYHLYGIINLAKNAVFNISDHLISSLVILLVALNVGFSTEMWVGLRKENETSVITKTESRRAAKSYILCL